MLIHRRYLKDKVQISFQLDSQSTILGSYQNIPDETAETNIIENNFNPSFPQNITQSNRINHRCFTNIFSRKCFNRLK